MDKDKLFSFIKEIVALFEKSSASELEVEEEGVRLILRKTTSRTPQEVPIQPPLIKEERVKQEPLFGDNVYILRSPMTGVFYRSPAPNAPPFVEEGDMVVKGQRLALLEAMKIFNDITADVSGKIVAILAENASLVQEGQPLFAIERMEENL
ncbi:acetyl-CoA carboxylase, biotin carboxyl carrier protein [bacterium]|nr:acetyl-CoA carboxylase, biotin carboxyl carrier protein [bacterium]